MRILSALTFAGIVLILLPFLASAVFAVIGIAVLLTGG